MKDSSVPIMVESVGNIVFLAAIIVVVLVAMAVVSVPAILGVNWIMKLAFSTENKHITGQENALRPKSSERVWEQEADQRDEDQPWD